MEENSMTLAEALSANRTETRSEAVPDFDLERLSKEIDADSSQREVKQVDSERVNVNRKLRNYFGF